MANYGCVSPVEHDVHRRRSGASATRTRYSINGLQRRRSKSLVAILERRLAGPRNTQIPSDRKATTLPDFRLSQIQGAVAVAAHLWSPPAIITITACRSYDDVRLVGDWHRDLQAAVRMWPFLTLCNRSQTVSHKRWAIPNLSPDSAQATIGFCQSERCNQLARLGRAGDRESK
jgi:hypothetical protein